MRSSCDLVEPKPIPRVIAVGPADMGTADRLVHNSPTKVDGQAFDIGLRFHVQDGHCDSGHGRAFKCRQVGGTRLKRGETAGVSVGKIPVKHWRAVRQYRQRVDRHGEGSGVDSALRVTGHVQETHRIVWRHKITIALLQGHPDVTQHIPLQVVGLEIDSSVSFRVELLEAIRRARTDGDSDPAIPVRPEQWLQLSPHHIGIEAVSGRIERFEEHTAAEAMEICRKSGNNSSRKRLSGVCSRCGFCWGAYVPGCHTLHQILGRLIATFIWGHGLQGTGSPGSDRCRSRYSLESKWLHATSRNFTSEPRETGAGLAIFITTAGLISSLIAVQTRVFAD